MNLNTSRESHEKLILRIVPWIIFCALMFPILLHAYLGIFSRYMADDYCTLGSLRALGLLQSQVYWYSSWSGRFSFTLVINLLELIGPVVTSLIPGMTLLLWVSIGAVLFHRLASNLGYRLTIIWAMTIQALVIFAVIAGVGNVFQSVYWLTGVVTYSVPLLLTTGYLLWVTLKFTQGDERFSTGDIFVSFLLPFIAGGFSETYVAVQTTALGLGICIVLLLTNRGLRSPRALALSIGLLGSLLALILVAVAPGNSVRQDLFAAPLSIFEVLSRSLSNLKIFLSILLNQELVTVLVTILIPGIAVWLLKPTTGNQHPYSLKNKISILLGIPILAATLAFVSFVPYEYALSSYPDARVLITTRWIVYSGIVFWSFSIGSMIPKRMTYLPPLRIGASIILILVGVVICILSYQTSGGIYEMRPVMREFAHAWQSRHEKLLSAVDDGEELIMAASLRHMGGLAEIGYNPKEWINRCVAQAYGIEEVVAK
jgi:hypothetical protein